MNKYIISAGSCDYRGLRYLEHAKNNLLQSSKFILSGQSRIFKNSSKYAKINRLYYNTAFAVESLLEPLAFYRELRSIESKLGRIRTYKNSPRTLDLDVLIAFNLSYKTSTFCVPHREAYARNFFVVCAVEALIAAHWPIPIALIHARARMSRDLLVACI
jgi:2-amino-4-hydroxy-6-hydroxymethyldihydropteridine diphosphokinase